MSNFLRAYNLTLIYVAGLTILGFIGYYSLEFSIAKASRIGTLYGFIIGVVLNIIPALFVAKRIKQDENMQQTTTSTQKKQFPKEHTNVSQKPTSSSFIKEMYLLLDKEMAFDVALQSILNQSLGILLNTNKHRGAFSVRTTHQTIDFEIQPLTRHTSKVNIKVQKQNDTFKDILKYIKEKEASILTY
jgi:hypothetical protein